MKRKLGALMVALAAAVVGFVVAGPVSAADPPGPGTPAVPVYAQDVGNGVRLYVDVFYGRGGNPGPPGGGGGGGSVSCTDDNTQTDYALFANESALTMYKLQGTFPAGLNVDGALSNAASQWNSAGAALDLQAAPAGSPTGPTQDGTSVIGFTKLAPKNVLAATWTYVDKNTGNVLEADLFFNTLNPWTVLSGCPSSPTGKYDVADIATHEMGHVLGLDHVKDANAQATMYPSAPSDEVRKVTLTQGEKDGLKDSVSP